MEWALRTIPFYQKQSGPSTTTFATRAQALDEWLRRIIFIYKSHRYRGPRPMICQPDCCMMNDIAVDQTIHRAQSVNT